MANGGVISEVEVAGDGFDIAVLAIGIDDSRTSGRAAVNDNPCMACLTGIGCEGENVCGPIITNGRQVAHCKCAARSWKVVGINERTKCAIASHAVADIGEVKRISLSGNEWGC